MAKLYKWSAEMSNAINDIVNILHDEYEISAGAGMRLAMNTLYAVANKMDTTPGYFFPLVQNDLWLAFNEVVTDGDINKFAYMLWEAHNAAAKPYYYLIRLTEEPEIAYYWIDKVYGEFPQKNSRAFRTMEEAEKAFKEKGYISQEEAEKRYEEDSEWRI